MALTLSVVWRNTATAPQSYPESDRTIYTSFISQEDNYHFCRCTINNSKKPYRHDNLKWIKPTFSTILQHLKLQPLWNLLALTTGYIIDWFRHFNAWSLRNVLTDIKKSCWHCEIKTTVDMNWGRTLQPTSYTFIQSHLLHRGNTKNKSDDICFCTQWHKMVKRVTCLCVQCVIYVFVRYMCEWQPWYQFNRIAVYPGDDKHEGWQPTGLYNYIRSSSVKVPLGLSVSWSSLLLKQMELNKCLHCVFSTSVSLFWPPVCTCSMWHFCASHFCLILLKHWNSLSFFLVRTHF